MDCVLTKSRVTVLLGSEPNLKVQVKLWWFLVSLIESSLIITSKRDTMDQGFYLRINFWFGFLNCKKTQNKINFDENTVILMSFFEIVDDFNIEQILSAGNIIIIESNNQ